MDGSFLTTKGVFLGLMSTAGPKPLIPELYACHLGTGYAAGCTHCAGTRFHDFDSGLSGTSPAVGRPNTGRYRTGDRPARDR